MAAMTFAAQCAAITKKGTQCKRQASPGSEYCWQHGGTTKAQRAAAGEAAPTSTRRANRGVQSGAVAPVANGQCQAMTKKGTQCKRKAQAGGKYCAQHAAMYGEDGSGNVTTRPVRTSSRSADKSQTAQPAAANGMCQAKTKNGEPCKRKAKPGSRFCWQHAE